MSAAKIALRYAQPVLELAEERKVLEEVKDDMQNLLSLCRKNRDFSLMLKSPVISYLKKAEILRSVFQGKVNGLTLEALNIITRKNREGLLEKIADGFLRLYEERKGLQGVSLTSGFELSDDQMKKLEKLAKDISGKKPVIEKRIDPDIIGGYILKVGDKQIDMSVRSQLRDIKLKLQTK